MSITRLATAAAAALFVCLSLSACHSPYVHTAIVNHSGAAVKLVEVDYPDASFGTQQIAKNATYRYHFKILQSGPIKISFTGGDNKVHNATGPMVEPGQQGSLTITLDGEGEVAWFPKLSPAGK